MRSVYYLVHVIRHQLQAYTWFTLLVSTYSTIYISQSNSGTISQHIFSQYIYSLFAGGGHFANIQTILSYILVIFCVYMYVLSILGSVYVWMLQNMPINR